MGFRYGIFRVQVQDGLLDPTSCHLYLPYKVELSAQVRNFLRGKQEDTSVL